MGYAGRPLQAVGFVGQCRFVNGAENGRAAQLICRVVPGSLADSADAEHVGRAIQVLQQLTGLGQ